jgi:hypothetical protein
MIHFRYGDKFLTTKCSITTFLLFREMTALHAAFAPKIIELAEQGKNLMKRNNRRQKVQRK